MFFTGGMFWKFQIKFSFVFENIQAIKCYSVPPDIDDTVAYEVPIGSSGKLTHCKGLRPWGYAQSSQSKEFKMGQDFFLIVEGVTVARTLSTLTVSNLIERRSNDMVVVWRSAAFVPCTGRLQRYTLACLRTKRQKKRCRRYCSSFPRVARESFIRQRCNRNSRKTLSLMLQKQHRKIND